MRAAFWIAALIGAGGLLLAAMPASALEKQAYRVERSDGDYEVRDYPATIAAEVTRAGSRDASVQAAFQTLANYIFAKERSGPKIAMTAPVTQSPAAPGDTDWTVRFLMPQGSTLASLPPPPAGVRLVELPPTQAAATRFTGRWTDANFAAAEAKLKAWVAAQGLEAAGPATFAYYDPPFKPWFLRRNEVLIPLAGRP